MAVSRINFTKQFLLNSTANDKKRTFYYDEKVRGLLLEVRPSGTKSFYLYKKIKGYPERIFLGLFPDLTIENARKEALRKLGEIASGINPQDELRAFRNENTFEKLFQEYMERYSKKHKKSWKYDEREVNKFLSHWFKRKISDIQKIEVQRLVEKIHDQHGLYQANRILERIKTIFNKAIEWGWDGVNPALGLKKYKEKARDRFILPNEMPCLLKALEEENTTAKDYLWMLLLTGARRTNTLMMQWKDISWEMNVWKIPDTKNGEPVYVPLVERALDILRKRKANSNSDWVFPSSEDPTKHLVNFKRAWKRTQQKGTIYLWTTDEMYKHFISDYDLSVTKYEDVNKTYHSILNKAKEQNITLPVGLMDIHIHDIRRTFGSYQAITGASLQIIGKSLGHKSSQSTQVYARLNLDPVRASIEKATQVMFG